MANPDTGAKSHYFTQFDAHVLVNVQLTKMGSQVILPGNITINPQKAGHLTLEFPPVATETMFLQHYKMNL